VPPRLSGVGGQPAAATDNDSASGGDTTPPPRRSRLSGAPSQRSGTPPPRLLDSQASHGDDDEQDDADAELKEIIADAPRSRDTNSQVFLITVWDETAPTDVAALRDLCSYVITQRERAPQTQRLHWQTLIVTRQRIKFRTLQRSLSAMFQTPPHIQPVSAKNDGYQKARNYCRKERTRLPDSEPIELGVWPFREGHRQGIRTDIHGAYEFSLSAPFAGPTDFANAGHLEAWLKYPRLALVQQAVAARVRLPPPDAYWFWGSTGTGKSARAYLMAQSLAAEKGWEIYERKNHMDHRWPGYTAQQIIIWDEFREVAPHQTLGSILSILDRGGVIPLDQKYGGAYLRARCHIFTAPTRPEEAFLHGVGMNQGQIDQLLRRFRSPSGEERVFHCQRAFVFNGPSDVEDTGADAAAKAVLDEYPL